MKKLTEKKIEKVIEFLELADSYGVEVKIKCAVYGNRYNKIIKDATKLFKGKLRVSNQDCISNKWKIWHNAKRGHNYTDGNLRFLIFYPSKLSK